VRRILITIIALECLLLLGGAVGIGLYGDQLRKPSMVSPVFRPPIYEAVTGDSVRFRRVAREDENRVLGYVDYEVEQARMVKNSGLGTEFVISMIERGADAKTKERRRKLRIQPELLEHGFLPPTFEELARLDVPGGRTVIRSIKTATVNGEPGFIIETVRPRNGLDVITERLHFLLDAPVFGVVRWERGDEVWILHRSRREPRREVATVE
jgi:hypothetical protein